MFDPEPRPGLKRSSFRKICANGFGDGNNGYAYSSAWFKDHLFIGTSRANLCMLKFIMPFVKIDIWPVDCPHLNYTPEFEHTMARAEMWRYSLIADDWKRCYRSPMIVDSDGVEFARDLGYRAMAVYQGESDPEPALYVASQTRRRRPGPELLRSVDGTTFEVLPKPRFESEDEERSVTAIRTLMPFKGRLFTAPTGSTKGSPNAAWSSLIYESTDPVAGTWRSVNDPGFDGPPDVATVYDLAVCHDHLYAGTAGLHGFQIWRTQAQGEPPYHWEKVVERGAGRGALNQGAVCMAGFKNALYVGTGIQNGGHDHRYKIGPAAAEIVRIHEDGHWDIVVGEARDGKEAISGLGPGFGNFFCGYIWRMAIHDGWLYAGTMDWTVILRFSQLEKGAHRVSSRTLLQAGVEDFVRFQGGFDLWRTWDGENWLPVTRTGFDNPYNFGVRGIVPTPHGLFIGTANPFGPTVATWPRRDGPWSYQPNPEGGVEVWRGI